MGQNWFDNCSLCKDIYIYIFATKFGFHNFMPSDGNIYVDNRPAFSKRNQYYKAILCYRLARTRY